MPAAAAVFNAPQLEWEHVAVAGTRHVKRKGGQDRRNGRLRLRHEERGWENGEE